MASKCELPAIHQSPETEVNLGGQVWDGRKSDASPIPPRKQGEDTVEAADNDGKVDLWSQELPAGGTPIRNFIRRLLR